MSFNNNTPVSERILPVKDIKGKDLKKSTSSIDGNQNLPNIPSSDKSILPTYIKEENNKVNRSDFTIEAKPDVNLETKNINSVISETKLEPQLEIKSETCSEIKPETKIKRCAAKNCNKRIGISNRFECKCGAITCTTHRFPDDHQCTIDHKKIWKEQLIKSNPQVVAKKIDRI